jgi:hypothetical protein
MDDTYLTDLKATVAALERRLAALERLFKDGPPPRTEVATPALAIVSTLRRIEEAGARVRADIGEETMRILTSVWIQNSKRPAQLEEDLRLLGFLCGPTTPPNQN